jgi:hypothetical protein
MQVVVGKEEFTLMDNLKIKIIITCKKSRERKTARRNL